MAVTEVFRRCKAGRREMRCIQRQIRELKVAARGVRCAMRERVQGGKREDRLAEYAAALDEMERTLEERIAQYVEDLKAAEKMLSRLSETEELVMREYYLNGLTNEQAADALGISDRHVRRAKAAAMRKLRGETE